MITLTSQPTVMDVPVVPPARKLPDDIMHTLCLRGLPPSEIVAILWEKYEIAVTRAAVSRWRLSHGYPKLRPTSESSRMLIPWRIRKRHSANALYRALQAEAQYREARQGRAAEPSDANKRRHRYVRDTYLADRKLVIGYDPNSDEGFFLVERRLDIDKDWIREPRIQDDGTEIIGPVPGLRD